MNHKKLRRLYRDENGCRCGGGAGASGRSEAARRSRCRKARNQRWSLDFAARCARRTDGGSGSWSWSTISRGSASALGRRHVALGHPGGARARRGHRPLARAAALLRLRQRHRDQQPCDPELVARISSGRVALHRARQAAAECIHRELHRPPPRRVPQRDALRLARSCPAALAAWKHDYNDFRPHGALDN